MKITVKLKQDVLRLIDNDISIYAHLIAKTLNLSDSTISRIIKELLEKNLIQVNPDKPKYPKFYRLTIAGKVFLKHGDVTLNLLKKEQNLQQELLTKPEFVLEQRLHKLRYKQSLISFSPFLNKSIRTDKKTKINDLWVIRKAMNNWDKYLIYFSYHQFHGLTSVEITNRSIIYNFKLLNFDSIVSSKQGFINFFKEKENACLSCAIYLNNKGFNINLSSQLKLISKEFAFLTSSNKDLGDLGKHLTAVIKAVNGEVRKIDDSPKTGGEEETDNKDKALSIYDLPEQIKELENKVEDQQKEIEKKEIDINGRLTKIENALIQLLDHNKELDKKFLETNQKLLEQNQRLTEQNDKISSNLEKMLSLLIKPEASENENNSPLVKSDNKYFI